MIRSILHLQIPLEAIEDSPRDAKESPKLVKAISDAGNFEVLAKIVQVLAKFERISGVLSNDEQPTICFDTPKI